MLDLQDRHRDQVLAILRRHVAGVEVRAFGSRAAGRARRHSDLDLLLMTKAPLEPRVLARLKDDLAESDLPFRVDVLDAADLRADFLATIERDGVAFA
jgi:type I restriction enzyme S subunit